MLPKLSNKKKRKIQAEYDPRAWLTVAEKKIASSQSEYDKRNFDFALSALQGVEERLAKSLLLQISLVAEDDSPLNNFLTSIVNKKYYRTPKALSHDWHRRMLSDVDDWLILLHQVWASQGNNIRGWRPKTSLEHHVKMLRRAVGRARNIKSNYSPDTRELTDSLTDCKQILDMAYYIFKKQAKSDKIKFPKRHHIHSSLLRFLRWVGVDPRSNDIELKFLEKSKLQEMKPKMLGNAGKIYRSTYHMMYVLITLAVLNVYLNEYHILGEYPTSKVLYNQSFPMVDKFPQIKSLLEQAIEMSGKICKRHGRDRESELSLDFDVCPYHT